MNYFITVKVTNGSDADYLLYDSVYIRRTLNFDDTVTYSYARLEPVEVQRMLETEKTSQNF